MAYDDRGTILIVDDNADIRSFAKLFLENAGYKVATAGDGEEGLCFYQEHQSSVVLLLTDIRMPKMNGLELVRRVLGINATLPVLIMSADTWSVNQGLESIAKPFRPPELIERVGRALQGRGKAEITVSAA